ncbi:DUF2975 domain-containing protein [Marinicauda algicola]|uniref:DUF2975 domain-containing protein n=1 Tax=Marinicauda algicola TaxID=2029849 RepID=A0A4S2H0E2_9PROT|nr:DUF2975 domain-containing protein [Marinicauda algicola]TGY88874.1 DUF2975 domain-containing protein [Marinicauda algicola]
MPVLKTLGPGSLASILKRLLDILYYLLWAALGLSSLVTLLIFFAGIYGLTGIGPGLPGELRELLQMSVVVALPFAIVGLIALTFIVHRLRRVSETLVEGDPFVPENAGHLRAIAFAILVYQLISYAAHGVLGLMLTLFGRPVESSVSLAPEFSVNLGAWFAVLALFVLAEVFREGARLREEQKLTI